MSDNSPTNPNRLLFPVALDVSGRRCAVVGGGAVGARKAGALAEAGAEVTIVSPTLCAAALELVSDEIVRHVAKPFHASHLDGAFLTVAATDLPAVNAEVAAAARARHILVNMAAPGDGNESETGDFVTMATVRRGDLLIAVTTGGAGPALSARIRSELSERYGEEWGEVVSLLAELRAEAKVVYTHPEKRNGVLRRVAVKADRLAALVKGGDVDGARKEAWACLSP